MSRQGKKTTYCSHWSLKSFSTRRRKHTAGRAVTPYFPAYLDRYHCLNKAKACLVSKSILVFFLKHRCLCPVDKGLLNVYLTPNGL